MKDQAVQIRRAGFPWREGIWGSQGGFPDVHIRHETSSIFNCHGGSSLLAKEKQEILFPGICIEQF
jgi:hypothetical protein